jgi:hypothetical protein
MAGVGRSARNKGANYERKIASLLSERFKVDVRRTGAQERWKAIKGDVNPAKGEKTILSDFFWELKNRESWSIINWYKKAVEDENLGEQIPIVVATKNQERDYVFLSLEHWLDIIEELEQLRKEKTGL